MTGIKGSIENLIPIFHASVDEEAGTLCLGDGLDDVKFIVDTGFTGGVSVPDDILDLLDLDFAGFDMFRLASGEVVEMPVYLGHIVVPGRNIRTWFIPGESLLGMEFLSAVGDILVLDFKASTVELTSR